MGTRTTSPSLSEASGFGLIGILLLVLTTTAAVFITAMLVPAISNRQARDTTRKGKALRQAINAYKANHGASPGTNPGTLAALVTNDASPSTCALDNSSLSATYLTLQGWCGPYLDQVIVENAADYQTDGWATPFQFDSGSGALTSCGPDLTCGDGDDLSF